MFSFADRRLRKISAEHRLLAQHFNTPESIQQSSPEGRQEYLTKILDIDNRNARLGERARGLVQKLQDKKGEWGKFADEYNKKIEQYDGNSHLWNIHRTQNQLEDVLNRHEKNMVFRDIAPKLAEGQWMSEKDAGIQQEEDSVLYKKEGDIVYRLNKANGDLLQFTNDIAVASRIIDRQAYDQVVDAKELNIEPKYWALKVTADRWQTGKELNIAAMGNKDAAQYDHILYKKLADPVTKKEMVYTYDPKTGLTGRISQDQLREPRDLLITKTSDTLKDPAEADSVEKDLHAEGVLAPEQKIYRSWTLKFTDEWKSGAELNEPAKYNTTLFKRVGEKVYRYNTTTGTLDWMNTDERPIKVYRTINQADRDAVMKDLPVNSTLNKRMDSIVDAYKKWKNAPDRSADHKKELTKVYDDFKQEYNDAVDQSASASKLQSMLNRYEKQQQAVINKQKKENNQ